jgi:predicted NUDIX family NTP pyrophosphohydrolase
VPKRSAGIVAYRRRSGGIEVLLAHPGGPFWTRKDDGAWSIPKGLYTETENPLEAAKREFEEEIGVVIDGAFTHLGEFSQPGGKIISAWTVEADLNEADFKSNLFEMEWPPRSGKRRQFPEVDQAQWFDLGSALSKIIRGQRPIIQALAKLFV